MDQTNLFYASYAKGFRVGRRQPAAAAYCDRISQTRAIRTVRRSPTSPIRRRTTRSAPRTLSARCCASRPASTTSSGTASSRASMSAGTCGLQFTDNLGTAVAKGSDLQAELAFHACKSILRWATPMRASRRTLRTQAWRQTAMRFRERRPPTTLRAPIRRGRSPWDRSTASSLARSRFFRVDWTLVMSMYVTGSTHRILSRR